MAKSKCSKPFYCDCDFDAAPSVASLLKKAMKEEKEAAKYYKYMAQLADCEVDRELFKQLKKDKERHFMLLQEIYRDLTCECYCVNFVDVKHPTSFCKGIKKAICNEMDAIKMYEFMLKYICDQQHKDIIMEIINCDKDHAQMLAALYKLAQECYGKKHCHKETHCECSCSCNTDCDCD